MERLTKTGEVFTFPKVDPTENAYLERVQKRLAAYEDTGMEPEEIKAKCAWADNACKSLSDIFGIAGVFDFALLRELVKARDEGRVVALPCRVGDTVYAIDKSWSGTVGEIVINDDGITLYIRCGGGGFYARPNDVRFARAEAGAALQKGGHHEAYPV